MQTIDQAITVKTYEKNVWVTPVNKTKYNNLKNMLTNLSSWKPIEIDIEEYLRVVSIDINDC